MRGSQSTVRIVLPKELASDEVVVIQTPDIPPVVDFKDLADPVTGHLLGKIAKQMLEDVMKELPPGRYSKEFVREQLSAQYGEELIKKNFPNNHVWGMMKDKENNLHAVYLGKKQGKEVGKGAFGVVKAEWSFKKENWDVVKIGGDKTALVEVKALNKLYKSGALIERQKPNPAFGKSKIAEKEITQYNLVMDYVKGVNLKNFLETHPEQSPAVLLDIAIQIAEQVAEVHRKGVLHCDIKPSNFMYDPISGKVTIIDAGLALELDDITGTVEAYSRGTQGFMAPEVSMGVEVNFSVKTDIYSLGVTLLDVLGISPIMHIDKNPDKPVFTTFQFKDDLELERLLYSMTTSANRRETNISNVVDRLKGLRAELLPISHKTTGILNVGDFINATPEEWLAFVHALTAVDTVILVDNENRGDVNFYSRVRRTIEKAGSFSVDSNIVISKDPSLMIAKIREQENKSQGENKEEKAAMVSQLCYFHPQGKPVKFTEEGVQSIEVTTATRNYRSEIRSRATTVSDRHLTMVRNALRDDLTRYMKKHSLQFNGDTGKVEKINKTPVSEKESKRVVILQKALRDVEAYGSIQNPKEKIHYGVLFAKFNEWQKAIQSTSKRRQFFGTAFLTPKGIKAVNKVAAKIQEEGQILPKMKPKRG